MCQRSVRELDQLRTDRQIDHYGGARQAAENRLNLIQIQELVQIQRNEEEVAASLFRI